MKTVRVYSSEIEVQMHRYYRSLSEKDRRRYAAIEAVKIGHGGISYIRRVLGCGRSSIRLGITELSDEEAMSEERQRSAGGGRKSAFETHEQLDAAFLRDIEHHTAGSPMDASIKWTHLTRQQIAESLASEEGIRISVTVVDQLLNKHQFRRRQASKRKSTGHNPNRNQQFEKINELVESYQAAGEPVMSMDTKKRELIGELYRAGHIYTQAPIAVYDHDWPSLATGKAIPHGLYDLSENIGYVQIGTSRDTHEFAIDSLRYWWHTYGRQLYPAATSLLLMCDGGGSNSGEVASSKQRSKHSLLSWVWIFGLPIVRRTPPNTIPSNIGCFRI